MKTYRINEIFYSLQGEGVRAGSPNFFVRFSGCNLKCSKEVEGFDCDTEFTSGTSMSRDEIFSSLVELNADCKWIIFTGGEPSLQLDQDLVDFFHSKGFRLAVETNGTKKLPNNIDWICVSPKTAEHTLKQNYADELKYVRAHGQGIPKPSIEAKHYLISPAFEANHLDRKTLEWCIQLVRENPRWRLSLQQHKVWKVR